MKTRRDLEPSRVRLVLKTHVIFWFVAGIAAIGTCEEALPAESGPEISAQDERIALLEQFYYGTAEAPVLLADFQRGLRLRTPDRQIQLRLGGRIHFDAFFARAPARVRALSGPVTDGVEFRRARVHLSADVHEAVRFELHLELSGGEPDFVGAGLELRTPFVDSIFLGEVREAVGMEAQVSTSSITFLERSLASELTPGRNMGIRVTESFLDERLLAAAGVHRDSGNGDATGSGGAFSARVAGLPLASADRRRLLHLGVSGSLRNPRGHRYRLRVRPEAHQGPVLIDNDDPATPDEGRHVDQIRTVAAEVAGQWNHLSLQGEVIYTHLRDTRGPDLWYRGASTQITWLVTGESRRYQGSTGGLLSPEPAQPFEFRGRGLGAVELAARASYLDATGPGSAGGELLDTTLGLHWILNQWTRVLLDYVHADTLGRGDLDIVQLRVQIHF